MGTHDYRGRLGDNHPIVNTTHDYLLGRGVTTRDEAEAALSNLPAGFGALTTDEHAAVLDRFNR